MLISLPLLINYFTWENILYLCSYSIYNSVSRVAPHRTPSSFSQFLPSWRISYLFAKVHDHFSRNFLKFCVRLADIQTDGGEIIYTSLASLAEVMMEGGQERREEIFFLYNLIFSNTIKKNRREHKN